MERKPKIYGKIILLIYYSVYSFYLCDKRKNIYCEMLNILWLNFSHMKFLTQIKKLPVNSKY